MSTAALQMRSAPTARFPQVIETGIYSGRYRERFPDIRAAGKFTTVSDETVPACLTTLERPETPDVIQKFQGTLQPKPGKARIFYSKRDDPQRVWAHQATHGYLPKQSPPAGVLLNPHPKTLFQQRIIDTQESVYQTHQRAPLGHTRDQSKHLPGNVDPITFTFGNQSESDGYAGDLINPNKSRPQVDEEYYACRDMYKLSHHSFLPGEQATRHYEPSFHKTNKYGMPTPNDATGKRMKKALRWISECRAERAATLVTKRVDEFRERTQPLLGQVHDPLKKTLNVPSDHTFGMMKKPDEYGVDDLMHGRNRGDYLRGKDQMRGIVAAMRHHLKKANYHNFDNMFRAFCFYDKEKKGKITMDCLRQVCAQYNLPLDTEVLVQLMDYCDNDKDGMIDYLEFCNFLNWKDKMPSGLMARLDAHAASALSAPLAGHKEQEHETVETTGRLLKQIDKVITDQKTSSSMINAVVGGPSSRGYRTYGVPTIRADLAAPTIKRVSDHKNYGDESNAHGLLNPTLYSQHGVYERDFLRPRAKEEIRDIFIKIGVELTYDDFDTLFEVAQSRHPRGEVSVESFRGVLDDAHAGHQ